MVATRWGGIWLAVMLSAAPLVWAQLEHEHEHEGHADPGMATQHEVGEQSMTGEVVDVFCYLNHGEDGLGKKHASCAKKCINGGLPVAIKVGDRLYLASMKDHAPANETLGQFAGQQVEVHGKVMERDGQRFIAVSEVEPAE